MVFSAATEGKRWPKMFSGLAFPQRAGRPQPPGPSGKPSAEGNSGPVLEG